VGSKKHYTLPCVGSIVFDTVSKAYGVWSGWNKWKMRNEKWKIYHCSLVFAHWSLVVKSKMTTDQ